MQPWEQSFLLPTTETKKICKEQIHKKDSFIEKRIVDLATQVQHLDTEITRLATEQVKIIPILHNYLPEL